MTQLTSSASPSSRAHDKAVTFLGRAAAGQTSLSILQCALLAAFILISIFLLWLFRPRDGSIKLPSANDRKNTFDIATPEDMTDGVPVDLPRFSSKVRRRKLLTLACAAAIVALCMITLILQIVDSAGSRLSGLAAPILRTIFTSYLLLLATTSLFRSDMHSHRLLSTHLACLTLLGTLDLFVFATLLRYSPGAPSTFRKVIQAINYTVLALYVIELSLAVSTPLGPALYVSTDSIYSGKAAASVPKEVAANVSGALGASILDNLMMAYATPVITLGKSLASLSITDLPVLPASIRAIPNFVGIRETSRSVFLSRFIFWTVRPGDGIELAFRLFSQNKGEVVTQLYLIIASALVYYLPYLFVMLLVSHLESDPAREHLGPGVGYALGLVVATALVFIVTNQMWVHSMATLQARIRLQLGSLLYSKTLLRKDVIPNATATSQASSNENLENPEAKVPDAFSGNAQVLTLMTTDVDRVAEFPLHSYELIDAPLEIIIGTLFLYHLLGVSAFVGIGVTCVFIPVNHLAGRVVMGAQNRLMTARDKRASLMSEILGAIRMIKFMALERKFEARVLKIRDEELSAQNLSYTIETLFGAIWAAAPVAAAVVAFLHFSVIRHEKLTPAIAFTAIGILDELKFALSVIPDALIKTYQTAISLKRIEKYLHTREISQAELPQAVDTIAFKEATVTWPRPHSAEGVALPSPTSFSLFNLTVEFPMRKLTLVCGRLGSGKTLLLLSLLGETDTLEGQVLCPQRPVDTLGKASSSVPGPESWLVPGACAYVPQVAWLRNASIKENILFSLPYDEERYNAVLVACALTADLEILEDGDQTEIGEQGITLSGGQKARVSLARALYSRASILLLDDILSAVDSHTAKYIFTKCLKGKLVEERTVILVSHHVQLCLSGADHVVALDNGRVVFQGPPGDFQASETLVEVQEEVDAEKSISEEEHIDEDNTSTTLKIRTESQPGQEKQPRKLVDDERAHVGALQGKVWYAYYSSCGRYVYWSIFTAGFILAALSRIVENGWLTAWTRANEEYDTRHSAAYYVGIYAAICCIGLILITIRLLILYNGSIRASKALYKCLLDSVMFASVRVHDTTSRGSLLNRFGKDFESIDSSLAGTFGPSLIAALSGLTTFVTITIVGGLPFAICTVLLCLVYYNTGQAYGKTSLSLRRLESVSRSPLYSLYSETISGVAVIRAFGASSLFLRDMLRHIDTSTGPFYWSWCVNLWVLVQFNLISAVVVGVAALISVLSPRIDAALAGFMISVAFQTTYDAVSFIRRFIGLQQSMVAVERVTEYSDLPREPPEIIEPRPAASWPSSGSIAFSDVVVRYAPDLPPVLHGLTFTIKPGEKVGILGRTGSGKSTLAQSLFRFVDAASGTITIDGLDIARVGLRDLRGRMTVIPQDPTILSGTVRSNLDAFGEYEDAAIFEALRRVQLIPPTDDNEGENVSVFRDLDSVVSEGGDGLSAGEKQLLCMARAILKRSKILVMDEATASVDYATDEIISQAIRKEFAQSTILTIAHRLRTIVSYDRVMVLDQGRIAEFDTPGRLLSDPTSKFYAFCAATGKEEFSALKKMVIGE